MANSPNGYYLILTLGPWRGWPLNLWTCGVSYQSNEKVNLILGEFITNSSKKLFSSHSETLLVWRDENSNENPWVNFVYGAIKRFYFVCQCLVQTVITPINRPQTFFEPWIALYKIDQLSAQPPFFPHRLSEDFMLHPNGIPCMHGVPFSCSLACPMLLSLH